MIFERRAEFDAILEEEGAAETKSFQMAGADVRGDHLLTNARKRCASFCICVLRARTMESIRAVVRRARICG